MIASRVEEKIQDVQLVIQNRELRIFKTGTKEAIPKIAQTLSQLLPVYGIEPKPEHLMEVTDFISNYKLLAVDEIKLAFEKFAKQEILSPFWGIWMPSAVLLPIGIFLVYKAMNDSQLFNNESYFNFFRKFKRKSKAD